MAARVHRITKKIIDLTKGNTFRQPGPSGDIEADDAREVKITPEYLKKVADTHSRMRKSGLNIPGPWSHKSEANKPIVVGKASKGGIVEDAAKNAGFWDKIWFDDQTNAMWGVIEAPGDPKDPNTPAGKLGTTVKETSIYVAPKWKDGRGNEWEHAPLHIACCLHGIEPGQDNFIHLEEGALTLSMSFQKPDADPDEKPEPSGEPSDESDSEDDDPDGPTAVVGDLGVVIGLLAEAGIIVPESSTSENFVSFLEVALKQFLASAEEEDDDDKLYQPPEGAQEKQAPFVMSFTPAQMDAIVKSGTVNPTTGKPFTLAELQEGSKPAAPAITEELLMSHPTVKGLLATTQALSNGMLDKAKSDYRARLNLLTKLGVVDQEYVDKTMIPMVEGLTMSFADGKPVPQPLDVILGALESKSKTAAFRADAPGSSPDYAAFLAMSHGSYLPEGATMLSNLPHATGAPTVTSEEDAKTILERFKKQGLI